ncbi:hypothetical protein B7494_g4582 [Chlorociboria aeruginascens]|nr:hypothetical protein B7494_g4582 [Chlorociboria aeruginascens]
MKLCTIIATMLVFLATGAAARNCTPLMLYCGSTLLKTGNYEDTITEALREAGQPETDGRDDLFHCHGVKGHITFVEHCEYWCKNQGTAFNDMCPRGNKDTWTSEETLP